MSVCNTSKKSIGIYLSESDLVFANGDTYDATRLVDAMYQFCLTNYPDHVIDITVLISRSESWYSGKGLEAAQKFFKQHGSDESLFINKS